MRNIKRIFLIPFLCITAATLMQCGESNSSSTGMQGGMSTVKDDSSGKDIVKIAAGSKDHTTLVTAVKTAGLLDSLANPGPFTVFAPTNAAFEKLPAGTVDTLLKPSSKADLENILQYHVIVGVFQTAALKDGDEIGMVNGDAIKVSVKNNAVMINDARIVASIPATNGIVHVVDTVLLPPKKK